MVICTELINTLPVNVLIEALLAKSLTLVSNEYEVNSILSNLWSVDDVYVLNPSNLVSVDDVYVFSELITVWSSYEPVFDSICPTLCSNDDVVDSIFVNLIEVDAVYAFSDEFSPPLSDTNPKAVICSEPDIVPVGIVSPLLLTNPNACNLKLNH